MVLKLTSCPLLLLLTFNIWAQSPTPNTISIPLQCEELPTNDQVIHCQALLEKVLHLAQGENDPSWEYFLYARSKESAPAIYQLVESWKKNQHYVEGRELKESSLATILTIRNIFFKWLLNHENELNTFYQTQLKELQETESLYKQAGEYCLSCGDKGCTIDEDGPLFQVKREFYRQERWLTNLKNKLTRRINEILLPHPHLRSEKNLTYAGVIKTLLEYFQQKNSLNYALKLYALQLKIYKIDHPQFETHLDCVNHIRSVWQMDQKLRRQYVEEYTALEKRWEEYKKIDFFRDW